MDLLYFIVLVSGLIFVHEFGHFVVAKAFGIKVVTFSVGFGPKLLRLRGKETEYCVGVFPLGGFVRMLEETRGEPVLPEDRRRTFEAQSIPKRVLVVLAGPLMNLIFPVILYFGVFATDYRFVPPTVGIVLPGHVADGKLLEGDRILSVDGQEIGTYDELIRLVERNPGREIKLRVFRNLGYVDVELVPEHAEKTTSVGERREVGRIHILPNALAPAIGVDNRESPAYRAGLRTFDVITTISGRPVTYYRDVAQLFADNRGETVPVAYLRPRPIDGALGGFADLAAYESGVVALTPEPGQGDLYRRTGIESADLYVAAVPPGSSEAQANLQRGDRIVAIDDVDATSWSAMEEKIFVAKTAPHKVSYVRDGRRESATFRLRHVTYPDETGEQREDWTLQMSHWQPTVAEPLVEHPHRFRRAARLAIEQTTGVLSFLTRGIADIATGRASLSQISGPLAIYEVAGREGARGAEYFLWVMAVISINLGLINLLPIPVLDGGLLVFLSIEAVFRRPLPVRVREVASLLGMVLLVSIMTLALKNDLESRREVILGQLRELFG